MTMMMKMKILRKSWTALSRTARAMAIFEFNILCFMRVRIIEIGCFEREILYSPFTISVLMFFFFCVIVFFKWAKPYCLLIFVVLLCFVYQSFKSVCFDV